MARRFTIRPSLARISQFHRSLLASAWHRPRFLPGDFGLLACVFLPALVAILLSRLSIVLLAWGGETGSGVAHALPYLLLLAAFVLDPAREPPAQRAIGLLLAFWIGGAPLTWAYVTLSAAEAEGGPLTRIVRGYVVWVPRKLWLSLSYVLRDRVAAKSLAPTRPSIVAVSLLLLVSVIGLWMRLDGLATRAARRPGRADEKEYVDLARKMMRGAPLELNHSIIIRTSEPIRTWANRTPGYPALLAIAYQCAGPHRAEQQTTAFLLQAVLDVLTGALLFLCLVRLLPTYAALVAAALWLTWLPAISGAQRLLPESATAFVLTAALGFALAAPRPLRWSGAGLMLAAAALLRPEFLGVPFVFGAGAALLPAGRLSHRLARVLLLMLLFAVGMTPWIARNHRVLGHVVPASTVGGYNFWAGNYLPLRGQVRHQSQDLARAIVRRHGVEPEDEVAVDRALWREGLSNVEHYLRAQTWEYAALLVRKVHDLWSIPFRFKLGPLFLPNLRPALLFLFIFGLWLSLAHWRVLLPMYGLVCYQTLAHIASYSHESRYLIPVVPAVFGTIALAIWFLTCSESQSDTGRSEQVAVADPAAR